ncbi:hypothetical protein [Sinorhizobium medicae]|uniref:hypothetical protein n=1 Tax=Sinorhizobium medicae TaxID=110321 RepID=UPI000FDA9112|nr:hypothetical protein [Sinorhizobium medicae]RVJ03353.1 hypothetical protein CN181_24875 [Sinorhizobium medicae]
MKNRLIDLNNHLFSQLERLTEENLSSEQIEQEVKRSEAIVAVSEQIIRNSDLSLKAANLVANHGDRFKPMLPTIFRQPDMIEGKADRAPDGGEK